MLCYASNAVLHTISSTNQGHTADLLVPTAASFFRKARAVDQLDWRFVCLGIQLQAGSENCKESKKRKNQTRMRFTWHWSGYTGWQLALATQDRLCLSNSACLHSMYVVHYYHPMSFSQQNLNNTHHFSNLRTAIHSPPCIARLSRFFLSPRPYYLGPTLDTGREEP